MMIRYKEENISKLGSSYKIISSKSSIYHIFYLNSYFKLHHVQMVSDLQGINGTRRGVSFLTRGNDRQLL
jgi:hypothetical protein